MTHAKNSNTNLLSIDTTRTHPQMRKSPRGERAGKKRGVRVKRKKKKLEKRKKGRKEKKIKKKESTNKLNIKIKLKK